MKIGNPKESTLTPAAPRPSKTAQKQTTEAGDEGQICTVTTSASLRV